MADTCATIFKKIYTPGRLYIKGMLLCIEAIQGMRRIEAIQGSWCIAAIQGTRRMETIEGTRRMKAIQGTRRTIVGLTIASLAAFNVHPSYGGEASATRVHTSALGRTLIIRINIK